MNIPEFSVKNSAFGNMITVAVFAAGLYAAFTMTRELFPITEMDIVVVRTLYRNASAEEVENHVSNPLEEEIQDIDGIDEYISVSSENISVVAITIDPDEPNKDRVINDISRKIDRFKVPDTAEKPEIEIITSKEDVIHVTISGDVPEDLLRQSADRVKARIEDIPGVGYVNKLGWRDPEIIVDVDAPALVENELPLMQVVDAVARQNMNMPGGKMTSGNSEILLRTIGEFASIKDVQDVVVRANTDGRHLTLADIAKVSTGFTESNIRVRANGARAIVLDVRKKRKGDAINIADAVVALVDEIRADMPEGVELGLLDFETYVIKRRLRVLLGNGLMGLVLVLCALPLALNWRLAIWTAIGIPFAFLATVLVMSTSGITINMITMFGIILVIGMLVDDAIIVAENIFRHMEMGKPRRQAAIDGAKEVMWPVTATILTTIAAFVPLMFLPGIMGKVLKWIPIVVIITLGMSLFEALVILPCHIAEFGGDGAAKRGPRRRRIWNALDARYERLLEWVLNNRTLFISCLFAILLGCGFLVARQFDQREMFPADLIEIFTVNITTPEGTTRDATEARTAAVERRLVETLHEHELKNYIAHVGHLSDMHGANVTTGPRYATIFVYLTPETTRERKAQKIVEVLREACIDMADIETLEVELIRGGPPVGRDVDIKLVGESFPVLDQIADKMKAFLETQPGVTDVRDDHEAGKEELRIFPDKREAARLGVSVDSISRTVYAAFEGAFATSVRDTAEETKVRVRLAEPYRNDEAYLKSLRVRNLMGRLIELHRVTTTSRKPSASSIFHFNGSRAVSVFAGVEANPREGITSKKVNEAVWEAFEDVPARFPGARVTRSGQWEENQKLTRAMLRAAGTALLLILTILVVQFKSFAQPFVVLAAIPFGFIGVVLALMAHGKPISIMAMLGMVGMCGVVVNDAIVLVSFINDLRRAGTPTNEAIRAAAKTRLRPIVLTSVTTVLGMAPVIYGIGGYEPFVAPAAIVLAYGLLFATVLTLLVIPCLYSVGADFKAHVVQRKEDSRAG